MNKLDNSSQGLAQLQNDRQQLASVLWNGMRGLVQRFGRVPMTNTDGAACRLPFAGASFLQQEPDLAKEAGLTAYGTFVSAAPSVVASA